MVLCEWPARISNKPKFENSNSHSSLSLVDMIDTSNFLPLSPALWAVLHRLGPQNGIPNARQNIKHSLERKKATICFCG